jgi:5-methylcytosine-specific restriction endonuclease McrA
MNSEERKEYDRQRYLKNKEKVKKRRVERYWEDVEHSRQKEKEYSQNRIEEIKEYRREHSEERKVYFKKRYYEALLESIEKLGGECVKCGATERLQFDHIHPENKSFEITKKLLMGDREKFQEELDKCQLLCYNCHLEKTKQSYLNGEFK